MPTPAPTFVITANPMVEDLRIINGIMTQQQVYTVQCSNGTASTGQFLSAIRTQYPSNSQHPVLSQMIVAGHQFISADSPNSCYSIAVIYAQVEAGSVPDDVTSDVALIAMPARVESIQWDFYPELSEVDKFGAPIINSAGDPFDPPGNIERARCVVTVSKWKFGFSASTYKDYIGKLNKTATAIPGIGFCNPRTARVLSIRPSGTFAGYVLCSGTPTSLNFGDNLVNGTGDGAQYGGTTSVGTSSYCMLMNPFAGSSVGGIASGTAFTSTNNSAGSLTTSSTIVLPPVKIYSTIEYRSTGFDTKDIDAGQRGWFVDSSSTSKLCQIHVVSDMTAVNGVVPLDRGIPALGRNGTGSSEAIFNTGIIGAWDTNTSNTDKLASRVADGSVGREKPLLNPNDTSSGAGMITLLTFKRADEFDFNTSITSTGGLPIR